jgi:hypothetical protein
MIATLKFVLLNEFCPNGCIFNADIFRVRHQSIKVEILEVDGAETCAWARKNAFEKQLDNFEGRGVGSHITREADAIATNGDAGAIRIILFRPHFTYHHGVADFLPFMEWDVMIVYKKEGVSARNLFCVGGRTSAYALAYLSKFIGVLCVPGGFVAGVTMGLAMFKEFASGVVNHQKSFWTTNKHQCLTEVCKTVNLCRLHSFAETCKTNWISRGPNKFSSGNVVSVLSPVLALVDTWVLHKNNSIQYVLTEELVAKLSTTGLYGPHAPWRPAHGSAPWPLPSSIHLCHQQSKFTTKKLVKIRGSQPGSKQRHS